MEAASKMRMSGTDKNQLLSSLVYIGNLRFDFISKVRIIRHMQVADFHCDLLSYLAEDAKRTPHDLASRASIPQLQAGGVKLQTLAIFTKTARRP